MKQLTYILIIIATFTSCTTLDVFEKSKTFSNHTWGNKDSVTATFEIKDTNTLYNLYFVLRHEDAYSYRNIWVNITMQSPDTTISVKRNFTLGDNEKWGGVAMSDIIEHRISFNNTPAKLQKGLYKFTIHQIMREDPLPHILSAGIRVEKYH